MEIFVLLPPAVPGCLDFQVQDRSALNNAGFTTQTLGVGMADLKRSSQVRVRCLLHPWCAVSIVFEKYYFVCFLHPALRL